MKCSICLENNVNFCLFVLASPKSLERLTSDDLKCVFGKTNPPERFLHNSGHASVAAEHMYMAASIVMNMTAPSSKSRKLICRTRTEVELTHVMHPLCLV